MTTASTSRNVGNSDSAVGVTAVLGALMLVAGLILLFNINAAVATLVWITGLSLILTGIGELVLEDDRTAVNWLGAAAATIGGVLALLWPGATLWVLAVIAGTSLLVTGVAHVMMALMSRNVGGWGWRLFAAIATMIAGLIALAWPGATVLVIAIVFGIRMVSTGISALGLAWGLHHLRTA